MIGHGLDIARLDTLEELIAAAAHEVSAHEFNGPPGRGDIKVLPALKEEDSASRVELAPASPSPDLIVLDEAHTGSRSGAVSELVHVLAAGSGKTHTYILSVLHRHRSKWGSHPPRRRQQDEFVGHAFGLSRFERRNLRALLLGLIERLGRALRERRDRLNGQKCRARVHLRTPLRGAVTRNAPPTELPVRLLQVKAGCLVRPPMLLAA
ncbi:hypothetical protein ABZ419_02565 [Streptomyces cinnamoneus]|uniref:hypothetical protein n=1 Tax=Streptomyces cinnamoneus TaxID=53446 RepID=UPI00340DB93F